MRSIHVVSTAVATVVGVLVISLPAHAGGDAAAGKVISAACNACHVAVMGDTPQLVGQRETYLAKQLKAFKSGDRKNPVMNAMAGQLSDADVANLAAYWSTQAPGSDATVPEDVAALRKAKMPFPRDFPKGYVLYATTNKEDQGSVSKAYINNVGFQAVKAGKPLPDGSAIFIVAYNAKLDANKKPVLEKDGSWALDKVKGYEGMEARAGAGKDVPELLRNANWTYGLFSADKAPRNEVNHVVCLACHKPQASNSFVFGLKKIQDKAAAK